MPVSDKCGSDKPEGKAARSLQARLLIGAGALLVFFTLTLPGIPYIWLSNVTETVDAVDSGQGNPRANFWRSVRGGEAGYTAVKGQEAAVLIHNNGQNWRQYRTNILAPLGSYLMAGVLVIIAAFFLLRGPIRLDHGSSGRLVLRFSEYQRIVHWFTAILFWLLALTGLILLYGRYVLIPLFGAPGFAITASACKEAHNLFGPIFLVALGLLFVAFAGSNFYEKGDIDWLKKGGGLFSGHASAGRFNLGEKAWFWLVCLFGLVVTISGFLLDFSNFGQDRDTIELAHVLHSAVGILFISIAFGHVYLGTIGTQGTLRGMTSGYVDENWAKHHHDRWVPETETQINELESANEKEAHGIP